MALEDIAALKGLGKVTQRDRRGKGNHSIRIDVSENKRKVASVEIVKYLLSHEEIMLSSLRYDLKSGKMIVNYQDLKEAESKSARGCPGCGDSEVPYFKG